MNEIRTTITYNLPILRKYMIFVRIYNLFGFPVKYELSYFAGEAHCWGVNRWVGGQQGINLGLHVVVRRNDVQEILDDAKIEIDAEGIGRQCNPTACHAVGEHRTDGFWNGILLLIV